jgi:DNA-binding MarR family transcriptional regulator
MKTLSTAATAHLHDIAAKGRFAKPSTTQVRQVLLARGLVEYQQQTSGAHVLVLTEQGRALVAG